MYQKKYGFTKSSNNIVILENGDRIDLRKSISGIKRQKRSGSNKYGARSAEYKGIKYHSTKEAEYAFELDLRLKAKQIKGWRRQVKISLESYGVHICNYYMDFVIDHLDGTEEYVEIKGYATDLWKFKWKMTEAKFKNDYKKKLTLIKVCQTLKNKFAP